MEEEIKKSLLQLKCPLVKSYERPEDINKLLVEKSEHRDELITWLVDNTLDKIKTSSEENEENIAAKPDIETPKKPKNNLNKKLQSIGIPHVQKFLESSFTNQGECLEIWKLLIRVNESLICNDSSSDWKSLKFKPFCLHHYDPPSLLPRDLEAEIKRTTRKMKKLTSNDLVNIKANYQEEFNRFDEKMNELKEKEKKFPSEIPAQKLKQFKNELIDFDESFAKKYQRFTTDETEVIPDLGTSASQIKNTLNKIEDHRNSMKNIRLNQSYIQATKRSLNEFINLE